jgi:error-prone DNA polymerase
MGFYQPAQIVIDARKHGVDVRPVDINYSGWDNKLEDKSEKFFGLRLGFRNVKGLREEEMAMLVDKRGLGFATIDALREVGISDVSLEKMADADAFRSICLDRRQALWEVSTRDAQRQALFTGSQQGNEIEEKIALPEMTTSEHVVHDYLTTSLSLKAHPLSFLRDELSRLNIRTAASLESARDGDVVKVAGLVLVRQRPGTASGLCFISIEDERFGAALHDAPSFSRRPRAGAPFAPARSRRPNRNHVSGITTYE